MNEKEKKTKGIRQAVHYIALIKTVHFISVAVVSAHSSDFVTFVLNVAARM